MTSNNDYVTFVLMGIVIVVLITALIKADVSKTNYCDAMYRSSITNTECRTASMGRVFDKMAIDAINARNINALELIEEE